MDNLKIIEDILRLETFSMFCPIVANAQRTVSTKKHVNTASHVPSCTSNPALLPSTAPYTSSKSPATYEKPTFGSSALLGTTSGTVIGLRREELDRWFEKE
jgi:hypothetical protein